MENTCETKTSCMQKIVHKIKELLSAIIGMVIGAVGGLFIIKL